MCFSAGSIVFLLIDSQILSRLVLYFLHLRHRRISNNYFTEDMDRSADLTSASLDLEPALEDVSGIAVMLGVTTQTELEKPNIQVLELISIQDDPEE